MIACRDHFRSGLLLLWKGTNERATRTRGIDVPSLPLSPGERMTDAFPMRAQIGELNKCLPYEQIQLQRRRREVRLDCGSLQSHMPFLIPTPYVQPDLRPLRHRHTSMNDVLVSSPLRVEVHPKDRTAFTCLKCDTV